MRRTTFPAALALLCAAALWAPAGAGAFGLAEVGVDFKDEDGVQVRQAGSHPFVMETAVALETIVKEGLEEPDGQVEDLEITLPEGFVGAPRATPRCSAADFTEFKDEYHASCADSTVLGYQALKFVFEPIPVGADEFLHVPIYNLLPPPGVAARIGFVALQVPVTVDLTLAPDPPYNVTAHADNISQVALFYSSVTNVWSDPGSPDHDTLRGECLGGGASPLAEPISLGSCPVEGGERTAFLTTPRACTGPLESDFWVKQWDRFEVPVWVPGEVDEAAATTEPGMVGCEKLSFGQRIEARPTSQRASSPSGLDFDLRIDDPGISSPAGQATSDIKKAVVTLPEGVTVNPAQAEGLKTCSEGQLRRETATSEFGDGCPAASKIGSVEVESPLLPGELFRGSLFVAEPFENRFGSLLALYMTVKHPGLGVGVRLAGRVDPDPRTGQLITTFGSAGQELPQLPFSDFRLHFREGARSPLVTPRRCGDYEVKARFTPWSGGPARTATSEFEIEDGVGGGPCPAGSTPLFEPGLAAGTLANAAGSHSPFLLRLTRRDGDQDLTRFDAALPKGLVARLAGIPWCPEPAIARAEGRDGRDELARPSCPAASQIGTVLGGAGVGSQLTYVPGKVYLAGPVGGAPLSVVGIVPAVAGPFDVGTVVVRQALDVDPRSAEVRVDGALSDPIPHILAGIPLAVRDIQVSIDRPAFTLNPTNCSPMATLAGIWGGGSALFSRADDFPVLRSARFQAADCQALGFEPRLGVRLRGKTKRGGHPALRAVYVPKPGDANVRRLALTFPRSAFVENANFRTICTRVQFAANACPPGSVYGTAKAWTPLLDAPLQGPVYLRSSDNQLPDAVFDLRGIVDAEVTVRIDSIGGRLRATVTEAPDVPVSRVVVQMQGADKGLFVNSRDICRGANRARAKLIAQSGRRATLRPRFRPRGCGKGKGRRARLSSARPAERRP